MLSYEIDDTSHHPSAPSSVVSALESTTRNTEGSNKTELSLLHQAVASLQLIVTKSAGEWQSALATEKTDRLEGDAKLDVEIVRESKERSAELDELADDIKEQVIIGDLDWLSILCCCYIVSRDCSAYGGI